MKKTKAKRALAARAVRVEPVSFDVYVGRSLVGWVDTDVYTRTPKAEWTVRDDDTRGRCVSLDAGVAALLAYVRSVEAPAAPLGRRHGGGK